MNSIEPLSDFWAESYIRLGKRSFLYFGNKVIISCYVVTIFFVFWLMVGFLASQSYANVWGDGWPGLGCDQHRHKLETENITQERENISFEYSQPAKSSPHTTTTTPDCQGKINIKFKMGNSGGDWVGGGRPPAWQRLANAGPEFLPDFN